MLSCLLLAGLAEGVGFATILPLLNYLGGSTEPTAIDRLVGQVLEVVGMEPSLGALLGLITLAMVSKGAFFVGGHEPGRLYGCLCGN